MIAIERGRFTSLPEDKSLCIIFFFYWLFWLICDPTQCSSTNLANGHIVPLGADHLHFNAIHQSLQLVPDVPGSSHGAKLDEVLIAPLCGEAALHPLKEKHIVSAISREPGLKVGRAKSSQ